MYLLGLNLKFKEKIYFIFYYKSHQNQTSALFVPDILTEFLFIVTKVHWSMWLKNNSILFKHSW